MQSLKLMVCNCAVKYVPTSNSSPCVLCVVETCRSMLSCQKSSDCLVSADLQECPVVPVQLAADPLSPAG